MIKFLDKKLIGENPYATAKIKRLVKLNEYGLPEDSYGGKAKYVAELKDSDLLLIVDNQAGITLDVAIKEQPKKMFKKSAE